MRTAAYFLLVAITALGYSFTISQIGKRRPPTTPSAAVTGLFVNIGWVALLTYLWAT